MSYGVAMSPGAAPAADAAAAGAAIYRTAISHVRQSPLKNAFTYRSYSWFVDVDHLPRLPRLLRPLAEFRAGDHLGDPGSSIRSNVERFLQVQGIQPGGGPIHMLTSARVLGYVFNPLTLFWCYTAGGELQCVVAEVHNTYGERHCYLLRPDAGGRAEADKAFFVSPFFAVDGRYAMTFTDPTAAADGELRVEITLARAAQVLFRASLVGYRDHMDRSFLSGSLRHPGVGLRTIALIRLQGTRLWLKHLPLMPRPVAPVQEGVTVP
jgi:DUF1365 family protein